MAHHDPPPRGPAPHDHPDADAAQEAELEHLLELEQTAAQDDLYPWFHIVQWAAETAVSSVVMRWDLERTWRIVNGISRNKGTFKEAVAEVKERGRLLRQVVW